MDQKAAYVIVLPRLPLAYMPQAYTTILLHFTYKKQPVFLKSGRELRGAVLLLWFPSLKFAKKFYKFCAFLCCKYVFRSVKIEDGGLYHERSLIL